MSERENVGREPSVDSFLDGESRSLEEWRWLWEGDRPFPIRSHRGLLGRVIVFGKRLLRGLVRAPQTDLWERQRSYNLFVQSYLERAVAYESESIRRIEAEEARSAARIDGLGSDLQSIQGELTRDLRLAQEAATADMQAIQEDVRQAKDEIWDFLESQHARVQVLEGFHNDGWDEVMDHTAALFSRLDQKLDRYRQMTRERWARLGSLLEIASQGGAGELARAVEEEKYVEFEGLFRGRETDIGKRLAPYLKILAGRGEVLDLGCGRGEALAVLAENGIPCRGVDSSSEMVERCHAKGLAAETGDLFDAIAAVEPGSLGGVVSFHVIEHLPAPRLERLVRLAWRALAAEGVLVFETPSPLSLVVGARNFWIDPTHLRPVHPDSLKAVFELNGFDPVERLDLQPFSDEARLPQVDLSSVEASAVPLAEAVTELRDRLDSLLYGFQDYAMIGYKPR